MDYEKLLERARKELPKGAKEQERFELPRFDSFNQGNITIIKNFSEVCKTIARDPPHIIKFLSPRIGTACEVEGPRLKINAFKRNDFLNDLLNKYLKKFVICQQCGKPDTEFRKDAAILQIKCKACGAKYTPKD